MKYIIIILLFCSCGPSISQKIESCNGDDMAAPFRIYTQVSRLMEKTGSLYFNFSDCITLKQVDSAKKSEREKAEYFLREYKKIID